MCLLLLAAGTDTRPYKGFIKGIFNDTFLIDGNFTSINKSRDEIILEIALKHLELEEKLIELLNKTLDKGTTPDPINQLLLNISASFVALVTSGTIAGVLVIIIARALMLKFERKETRRDAETIARVTEFTKLDVNRQTNRTEPTIEFRYYDEFNGQYLSQGSPRDRQER